MPTDGNGHAMNEISNPQSPISNSGPLDPKRDLLPCPFCGSPAEAQVDYGSSRSCTEPLTQKEFSVQCSNADCHVILSTNWLSTRAAAIAEWNLRATPCDTVVKAHAEQLRQLSIDLGKDLGSRFPEGGIMEIATERARQIRKGYTPEHDDQRNAGELADAARLILGHNAILFHSCTSIPVEIAQRVLDQHKDRLSRLRIAGALIAAEIDRMRRVIAHAPHAESAEPAEERDTFNPDAGLSSQATSTKREATAS